MLCHVTGMQLATQALLDGLVHLLPGSFQLLGSLLLCLLLCLLVSLADVTGRCRQQLLI